MSRIETDAELTAQLKSRIGEGYRQLTGVPGPIATVRYGNNSWRAAHVCYSLLASERYKEQLVDALVYLARTQVENGTARVSPETHVLVWREEPSIERKARGPFNEMGIYKGYVRLAFVGCDNLDAVEVVDD